MISITEEIEKIRKSCMYCNEKIPESEPYLYENRIEIKCQNCEYANKIWNTLCNDCKREKSEPTKIGRIYGGKVYCQFCWDHKIF